MYSAIAREAAARVSQSWRWISSCLIVEKKLSLTALMLLCSVKRVVGTLLGAGHQAGLHDLEDLASDVAFEAAENLWLRQALLSSACAVLACPTVAPQSHESDNPESAIGVAIAAAVQAVSVLLAGGGIDWRDAAEGGKGFFSRQASRVVAGGNEKRAGDIDSPFGQ